ncbi:RNA polymerase subunit sigma-24 [Prosthecochloris sp. HL-130-GSB]|jgi:DNA-directed RNA polymerase specialized sigma24 family protein|uniref:RNA polymerase subunit sigma-24 n=1 Tax=Prosthecochloris sp. HL-130-GSB TaxID=1974213 RepID=UPI000A1C14DE|nr:RNA polymerase subunit sigma-24 [Prosthecochloris sp. HL-130-GSB]ARM30731.1 RNA polymerase subunit sigma-24 [Prosthecochloris sp. HL-130-GSB]
MIHIRKTPLELLDDIYSLAYWMTGSEKASEELVNRTYVNIEDHASEQEIFKTFRDCYVDSYGQQAEIDIPEGEQRATTSLLSSLKRKAADVKLSVLLSEVSGLHHAQISQILDKPVETIRTWLFWGRKFIVRDSMLKASA